MALAVDTSVSSTTTPPSERWSHATASTRSSPS